MSNLQETLRLSPSRALTGCLIGALAGFGPDPSIGPGLWITLIVLFLLLRTPLLPLLSVGILTKLLALISTQVAFKVGVFLLDGPTSSFFGTLINAPFTALFGLEYYVGAGGLLLGLTCGLLSTPLVLRLRTKTSAGRRPGLIRPAGVVGGLVFFAGLWLLQLPVAQKILTAEASSALGRLNGATVDVANINLDLNNSSLTISDLSFANPRELGTDIFRGLELSANLESSDLLRKRVHINRMVVRRAESGRKRELPGILIGESSPPEVEAPSSGERGIDSYIKNWDVWKQRLGQARMWIEKLSQGGEEVGEATGSSSPLSTRIATNLIEQAPLLLISELLVEGLTVDWLESETLTFSVDNLSTQPGLVDQAMNLSMKTKSDLFKMNFELPSGERPGNLAFTLRNLSVDSVASMLNLGDGASLSGGTLDLSLSGPWNTGKAGYIDLPLVIKLRNINLALGGSRGVPISELVFPVNLSGPLDSPNVRIDMASLSKSLQKAGAAELSRFINTEKAKLVDRGKAELQEKVGGKLGKLLGQDITLDIENLDQTKRDLKAAARKSLEESAKQKATELLGDQAQPLLDALNEGDLSGLKGQTKQSGDALKKKLTNKANKEAQKALKKGLQGLFGGKKKDSL